MYGVTDGLSFKSFKDPPTLCLPVPCVDPGAAILEDQKEASLARAVLPTAGKYGMLLVKNHDVIKLKFGIINPKHIAPSRIVVTGALMGVRPAEVAAINTPPITTIAATTTPATVSGNRSWVNNLSILVFNLWERSKMALNSWKRVMNCWNFDWSAIKT
jgi:hypothetical protein